MTAKYILCMFIFAFFTCIGGYEHYRALFPNGFSVPNICGSGIWEAVGHFDPHYHTIEKNKFGLDFSANGHVWNEKICRMDSDGDFLTNGEELGDPHCIWVAGAVPEKQAIGHPGICQPVGASICATHPFRC